MTVTKYQHRDIDLATPVDVLRYYWLTAHLVSRGVRHVAGLFPKCGNVMWQCRVRVRRGDAHSRWSNAMARSDSCGDFSNHLVRDTQQLHRQLHANCPSGILQR